jgi:alpha-methylacyl-CoA racemase
MVEAMSLLPLAGVKVAEFGSIGPGPFAASLLVELGADVIRLQRTDDKGPVDMAGTGVDKRGRPVIEVDLKTDVGRETALGVALAADAVLEGFRPGVMERLGLGPDVLLAERPDLVYARITGYGQTGPWAHTAGHDINYLAMSGVLHPLGRRGERPAIPLNLVADYGGGGMLVALGVVSGVLRARASGVGGIVDAAMVDGAAQLASLFFAFDQAGVWGPRGLNVLDSGAPFYEVYETADGGYMATGAVEPQFYAALLHGLQVDPADAPQWDLSAWSDTKKRFAEAFAARTRDEWCAVFEGTDACTTPVLSLAEAPRHPHQQARRSFIERAGALLPAPAPRFDGALFVPREPSLGEVLGGWDIDAKILSRLLGSSAPETDDTVTTRETA